MTRQKCDWCILFLFLLHIDGRYCEVEHSPSCLRYCAGQRTEFNHINCLFRCEQAITEFSYRQGRSSYGALLPATSFGDPDENGGADDLESIEDALEIPVFTDHVVFREPRDRSAFVRIGKRDLSAVTKGRDEFVRMGKDEFVRIGKGSRPVKRSPFLLNRFYTIPGRISTPGKPLRRYKQSIRTDQETLKTINPTEADNSLVIPIPNPIKKPSAFVRIGKKRKVSDEENIGSLLSSVYTKSALAKSKAHGVAEVNDHNTDELLSGPEEAEQMDKKASAFVRIGRKPAAFVRIGKYDPNNPVSE